MNIVYKLLISQILSWFYDYHHWISLDLLSIVNDDIRNKHHGHLYCVILVTEEYSYHCESLLQYEHMKLKRTGKETAWQWPGQNTCIFFLWELYFPVWMAMVQSLRIFNIGDQCLKICKQTILETIQRGIIIVKSANNLSATQILQVVTYLFQSLMLCS